MWRERNWSGVVLVPMLLAAVPTLAVGADAAESPWVSSAKKSDMDAALAEVREKGLFARVAMRCAVEASGELSGCRIIRETPSVKGIGPALLALAPKFRRKPPGEKDLREVIITDSWFPLDKLGDWARRPTESDLRKVFPVEAYKRGISGMALIECISTVQGALIDCLALEEAPANMGFGGAAIALTPQFMMKPAEWRGAPAPSIVRIPINFKMFGRGAVGESKRVAPPNLAWMEAPTYADVVAAYPKKARAERVGGRATLACGMTREGRLSNCEVISSNPRNYGFDGAARALAKSFRLQVTTPGDVAAARDLMFHLPVTFDPGMLDQKEPVVGKPNWAALPEADAIVAAFEGLKAPGTVRVQLRCVVQPAGYVGQCTVGSEQPAGIGAGTAALSLAPSFRLTTWTAEGLPTVGSTVTIPLRYEPGDPAKPSPPPAGH